eukprot:Selendium_serpulae@DN5644_c2_g1_i1.p1
MCAYCYLESMPFSTWGDSCFVAVQAVVAVLIYWKYAEEPEEARRQTPGQREAAANAEFIRRVRISAGYVLVMSLLLGGFMPSSLNKVVGFAPTPIAVAAKVPQVISNYRQGHTGQLSFLTLLLSFTGCAARLVTTLALVDDPIVLMTWTLSTIANGIPMMQILLYWDNTTKVLNEQQAKGDKKTTKEQDNKKKPKKE